MAQKVDPDPPTVETEVCNSRVGMVACSQPLAAEAGLEILRKGGNAGKPPSYQALIP